MSTINDTTFELFKSAALSDTDFAYPRGTMFVPGDTEGVDDIVWTRLHDDKQPVVIVLDDVEVLFAPSRRMPLLRMLDDARGRVTVSVAWRHHDQQYTVKTRVGKHPLSDLRRPLQTA